MEVLFNSLLVKPGFAGYRDREEIGEGGKEGEGEGIRGGDRERERGRE